MLSQFIKTEVMNFIASKCFKCGYHLSGTYKELEVLKVIKNNNGISVYVSFGSVLGIINNIKILDSMNNVILEDEREFNKTSSDTLTIVLRLERIEVLRNVYENELER